MARRLVGDEDVAEVLGVEREVRRRSASVQYLARSADDHFWIVKLPLTVAAHREDMLARELLGYHIARTLDLRVPHTKLVRLRNLPADRAVYTPTSGVYVAQEEIAPGSYRPVRTWPEVPETERLKLLAYGAIVAAGEERFDGDRLRDVARRGNELIVFDLEGINGGGPLLNRDTSSAAGMFREPTIPWSSAIAQSLRDVAPGQVAEVIEPIEQVAIDSAVVSEWTHDMSLLGTGVHVGRVCDWLTRNARRVREDLVLKLSTLR